MIVITENTNKCTPLLVALSSYTQNEIRIYCTEKPKIKLCTVVYLLSKSMCEQPNGRPKTKKKKKSAECLHLHIKISRTNWLSYFRVWFASFFSQFTWGKSLCGRIAKQKKNSRQTNKDANNHISSSIVHIPWFFRLLSGALWIFFGCWLLSAWIVHSYNVRDKSENSLWIIQWCVDRNTTLVFIP